MLRKSEGHWIYSVATSFNHGSAFLDELLAVELGLKHRWKLGYREVVCFSNCANIVEILQLHDDVVAYWARETIARVRAIMDLE